MEGRTLMRVAALAMAMSLHVLAAVTYVAAQPLTPLSPASSRYFTASWETFDRQGQPYLRGYVENHYGAQASRIQLLAESLDASGQIVAQRVEWLGSEVGPFSRRYFEIPAPQRASSYRVSVFAFDFLQAALSQAP